MCTRSNRRNCPEGTVVSRIMPGERLGELSLPALDNNPFDVESLSGQPFLLSFYRFASCPFCNLRINELVNRYDDLPQGFGVVAVFDSPLDNLQQYASVHNAPFPILADENNVYYRRFAVERSVPGVLKGMILRMPALLYAMFVKGYVPLRIKGSMTTMPLDLLVDGGGIVRMAYYGKDEGDHLPFAVIQAFARESLPRKESGIRP